MPNPTLNPSEITLYARIVTLSNNTQAYAVTKYTYAGNVCQIPFGQGPGIEGDLCIQLWGSSPTLPPVDGTDPNGECDVGIPFKKYVVNVQGVGVGWVLVYPDGIQKNECRFALPEGFIKLAIG